MCFDRAQVEEAEARAASRNRSQRRNTIVGIGLVIGVPAIMIAAGAGKYVGGALIGLGFIGCAGASTTWRRAALHQHDERMAKSAILLFFACAAILIAGLVITYAIF